MKSRPMKQRLRVGSMDLAILSASLLLSGCRDLNIGKRDGSHGAIAACEEVVKEQLVSPSTYKRVKAYYDSAPAMTHDEAENADELKDEQAGISPEIIAFSRAVVRGRNAKEKKEYNDAKLQHDERAKRNEPQDRTAYVTIEYDAQNRFGAMLRSLTACRFGEIGVDGAFDRSDLLFTFETNRSTLDMGKGSLSRYEE